MIVAETELTGEKINKKERSIFSIFLEFPILP